MKAQLKKILIGMAAGAFGLAMVACGGDVEMTEDGADDTESSGGEVEKDVEIDKEVDIESDGTETETETDTDVETETETDTDVEGGEAN